MDTHTKQPEKLAYQVNEAVHVSGLGRTTIYEMIKAEKLKTVKAEKESNVLKELIMNYGLDPVR